MGKCSLAPHVAEFQLQGRGEGRGLGDAIAGDLRTQVSQRLTQCVCCFPWVERGQSDGQQWLTAREDSPNFTGHCTSFFTTFSTPWFPHVIMQQQASAECRCEHNIRRGGMWRGWLGKCNLVFLQERPPSHTTPRLLIPPLPRVATDQPHKTHRSSCLSHLYTVTHRPRC